MTKAGLVPLRTEKELIPFLGEGDKPRGAANRKCTVRAMESHTRTWMVQQPQNLLSGWWGRETGNRKACK